MRRLGGDNQIFAIKTRQILRKHS